jgi:hypothetical protein
MTNRFQVGDPVEWKSQAGECTKKKQGVVADIMPANTSIRERIFNLMNQHGGSVQVTDLSCSRDHESYIIAVPNKTIRSGPAFYWPYVSQLKRIHPVHITWGVKGMLDIFAPAKECPSTFSWDLVPKHDRYMRYYVMYGLVCKKDRGFRTRQEVDAWIEQFGDHIVYQDAKTLTFILNDLDSQEIKIVDKNGDVYER